MRHKRVESFQGFDPTTKDISTWWGVECRCGAVSSLSYSTRKEAVAWHRVHKAQLLRSAIVSAGRQSR